MAEKKIPCRVCKKLFEPCAYCKSHEDTFRWRNFACSRECAAKYIEETTAYRESLHNEDKTNQKEDFTDNKLSGKNATTRKKLNKKSSEDILTKNQDKGKETD